MTVPPLTIDMEPNETYILGNTDYEERLALYNYSTPNYVVLNLPKESKKGDTLEIYATSIFKIQPQKGIQILFFATHTENSRQGCIISCSRGQWIKLLCTSDNTEWMHVDSIGNFEIE
jgi:hypothetical protein